MGKVSYAEAETRERYRQCIVEHEKQKGIEPGLMEAIAQIESKLNPYIVNACGRAFHFKTASDAARFVKEKQNQGYRNISVGLTQLHVPSHRSKFGSLEEMMDPGKNVAYAANLLKRLKRKTGSWEKAVRLYHSPNPCSNERYKNRVFGAWAKIRVKRGQTSCEKGITRVSQKTTGISRKVLRQCLRSIPSRSLRLKFTKGGRQRNLESCLCEIPNPLPTFMPPVDPLSQSHLNGLSHKLGISI